MGFFLWVCVLMRKWVRGWTFDKILRRRRKKGFLDQINRVFDISRKVQRDFEKSKTKKKVLEYTGTWSSSFTNTWLSFARFQDFIDRGKKVRKKKFWAPKGKGELLSTHCTYNYINPLHVLQKKKTHIYLVNIKRSVS